MPRVKLTDEERVERRKASILRYAEKNREKMREATKVRQRNRRLDPAVREQDGAYKKTEKYIKQQAEYRAANSENLNQKTREWQIANKEQFEEYQRRYRAENAESERARSLNWKRENAESEKYRLMDWAKNNSDKRRLNEANRRASKRHAGGKLSEDIQPRLMRLQRGKCACCKCDLGESGIHLDHVIPLSKGGLNVDGNIQLLCPSCNLSKHAKHPVDFMQSRGFLI